MAAVMPDTGPVADNPGSIAPPSDFTLAARLPIGPEAMAGLLSVSSVNVVARFMAVRV